MLATLLNPYTWKVYQYVGLTSTAAAARNINEWVPPGLNHLVSKFWVVSLLGLILLWALPGRRPPAREVCLILCFLPLACGSVRMIAWWLFILAPIAAAGLATHLPAHFVAGPDEKRPNVGAGLFVGLYLIVSVLALPWLENYNPVLVGFQRTHHPESDLQAAADALRARLPSGRIFSRFEWGEYLGWALTPDFTVFMDGRIEIYPDPVWDEYLAISRGRADWQQILDRYEVNCLVLDPGKGYHAFLLGLVEDSPIWGKPIFQSDSQVVFVRQSANR